MLSGAWHAAVVFVVPAMAFGYYAIPTLDGQVLSLSLLLVSLSLLLVSLSLLLVSLSLFVSPFQGVACAALAAFTA